MASASHPYRRPPGPIRVKCVGIRTTHKAQNFELTDRIIKPVDISIMSWIALSDGSKVFLAGANSEHPPMMEGNTYIIKNYKVSFKYGKERLFLGPQSSCFKTTPLPLSDELETSCKEALVPSSREMKGGEQDLFSWGGYVTLHGRIENLQVPRMIAVKNGSAGTMVNVPILDFTLKCEQKPVDVSLWREEALAEICLNDHVVITHLKASIMPNGQAKFNSSTYTTIKVDKEILATDQIMVIGLSEAENGFTILSDVYDEFFMPSELYSGTTEDLFAKIPMKVKIEHQNNTILKVDFL